MAKTTIPNYGTVTRKGILYYRTRITDADGKRVDLYAPTCEELYEKETEARRQIEDNNRIALLAEAEGGNITLVRASRVPVRKGGSVSPVLITEPRLDLCELKENVILQVINAKTSFTAEDNEPVLVDYAEWNYALRRMDFYFADEPVAWIQCDAYRLYGPDRPAPTGRLIRFAAVRFQPNGRSYDYLCDDPSVRAGDTVIVPGYNGETAVEVERIFTQYESQLSLPLERYKKVRGKAETDGVIQ